MYEEIPSLTSLRLKSLMFGRAILEAKKRSADVEAPSAAATAAITANN